LPIEILEEAFEEASEAAAWYEKECEGLGYDFFEAVEAAFDIIEDKVLPLWSVNTFPDTQLRNFLHLFVIHW